MKSTSRQNLSIMVILLTLLLPFAGCKKDDPEPAVVEENEALLGVMNDWYYYYNHIPDVDASSYETPYDLLEAVRYLPYDRWSYIDSWADFYAYYNESKYYGYGFGSSWSGGKLYVSFVYRKTQMYERGVRRGWILDAVNGTKLQQGMSLNQMLNADQPGVTNTFRFIQPDNSTVDLSLPTQEVTINSVIHAEVIERPNHKVGYFMLQNFTSPTVAELDSIFAIFIAENINELVLDLRYNGGGSAGVANYLASMIGGDKVVGKPFTIYSYNDKQAATSDTTYNFMNVDKRLNIDRLITICTRGTASASELVINSLKPFMPVYIVGNDTYGKPMGSHVWNYGNLYAYVILSFKTKNALGEGDYFDGLPANIYQGDDLTHMFGNPEEANLREALRLIETGVLAKGSRGSIPIVAQPQDQMRGLQAEIGAY
jgi:carboxyl-terminal processing protease